MNLYVYLCTNKECRHEVEECKQVIIKCDWCGCRMICINARTLEFNPQEIVKKLTGKE